MVRAVQSNILDSDAKHIVFAINKEGYNDTGFAGEISKEYWEGLQKYSSDRFGKVFSKTIGDKTFYAIVCYSIDEGWPDNTREIIKESFDKIQSNGEPIDTIPIGTRYTEKLTGADFKEIVNGMQDSKQEIYLHSNYTSQDLKKMIEKDKKVYIKK